MPQYNIFKAQCMISQGESVSKKITSQLDPYSRFETVPACDRQTDMQTDTRRQHIPRWRSVARLKARLCGRVVRKWRRPEVACTCTCASVLMIQRVTVSRYRRVCSVVFYSVLPSIRANDRLIDLSIYRFELRFNVPLDTKRVISETTFPATTSWLVLKKIRANEQNRGRRAADGYGQR